MKLKLYQYFAADVWILERKFAKNDLQLMCVFGRNREFHRKCIRFNWSPLSDKYNVRFGWRCHVLFYVFSPTQVQKWLCSALNLIDLTHPHKWLACVDWLMSLCTLTNLDNLSSPSLIARGIDWQKWTLFTFTPKFLCYGPI